MGPVLHFIAFTFNIFFPTNDLRLPMSFLITFLPFEEIFSLNWFLNYFFQFITCTFLGIFFFPFVSLTLIALNHSCWGIDILILMVQNFNEKIDYKIPKDSLLRKEIIKKEVKGIVEMTFRVQTWRKKLQSLMEIIFFMDFSSLSFLFCICLYNISLNPWASQLIMIMCFIIFFQLFVYCWMGTRLITRIENLTIATYDINWHLLDVTQRKDFLKILMMAQNMKGFNGIFHSVNFETFKTVNFSFFYYNSIKLFLFLRSWNSLIRCIHS